MDDDAIARAERRRANAAAWPIRRHRLGEEPALDPLDTTTPSERVGLVWPLTLEMWRLAGLPMPAYRRADMPGRVLRGRR